MKNFKIFLFVLLSILTVSQGYSDNAPESADESIFKAVCDPGSAYGGDR